MNISYLIENTNHVYVDNKLLDDYKSKKPTQTMKSSSPREKRPGVNSNPKAKSPSGQKKQKDIIYKVPKKPNSNVYSEEECVEILSAKIIDLQSRQASIQQQYSSAIEKLQSEIHKRDEEYERDLREVGRVRDQLTETKKDIEALIEIARSNKRTEESNPSSRALVSPRLRETQKVIRSMKELS